MTAGNMVKRNRALGLIYIFMSNVLFCLLVMWLRDLDEIVGNSTLPLILGNAFCSLALLSKGNSSRPRIRTEFRDGISIILWSFSYCACYYLFFKYKSDIALSHLIVAESITPIISVWLTGEMTSIKPKKALNAGLSIGLLLVVAMNEWSKSEGEYLTLRRLVVFGLVMVCFLVSQVTSRILANTKGALWVQPRLAFLNVIGLSLFFIVNENIYSFSIGTNLAIYGVITGFLVLSIQVFLLWGLRMSNPVYSALVLSSSVPISVVFEAIWIGKLPNYLTIICSFIYCILVFFLVSEDKVAR